MSSYGCPAELVTALRNRDPAAREELARVCGGHVARLAALFAARLHPPQDPDRLAAHALRWAGMHLACQEPARFEALAPDPDRAWVVFRNAVLVSLARIFAHPPAPQGHAPAADASGRAAPHEFRPTAAPDDGNGRYAVSVFCRPCDAVGGDIWRVCSRADVLWALVADVCGHSWPAHLLARGLPGLLDVVLDGQPAGPGELLDRLEQHLQGCLPEGLFVEAVVGRVEPHGQADVMTAGGPLVLVRHAGTGRVRLVALGGPLLGLGLSGPRDHYSQLLEAADELVLASDGVKDWPLGPPGLQKLLADDGPAADGGLHGVLVGALEEALRGGEQADDITVLTVRRR